MQLPNRFLVLLMSVAILVDSSPHIDMQRQQLPGRGISQDTIFPNRDFGVDGLSQSSSKRKLNSTSNLNETGRQPGCTALPDPGECRGAFLRYYYNQNIDQCDCFLFGGCDEALVVYTSWLTFQECLNACVPGITTKGPRCKPATLQDVLSSLSRGGLGS